MRKLFLAMAAVAALLASCSKDDVAIDTPVEGGEVSVTFDVSSPELATRYGEGNKATTLEWFVYEGTNPTLVSGLTGSKEFQHQTNVTIKFIMGRTYHVLFWAHDANAPYEVTANGTTAELTVDYANLTANEESYDAFFNFHKVGLVSSSSVGGTVTLNRPFAQLNVATSDTADAEDAGYKLAKTGIEVKTYGKMNFMNGSVSDPQTITTFALAPAAEGTITAKNGQSYDHISMNYLLVNEKEQVDVKLLLQEEGNDTETLERVYTTIPVQRNHRTNILGNVFTKPADFTVVIDEKFTNDYYEEWDGKTYDKIEKGNDGFYSVSHAAEFAWILKEETEDVKIRLEADINFGGNQIPEWGGSSGSGSNVVIEGNGNTIYNFKNVSNATRDTTDEAAGLFEVVNGAEVSNLTIDGAEVDAGEGEYAYAGALFGCTYNTVKLTNVTVKNSSVAGTNKVGGLIGLVAGDSNDLTIENCHVIDTDITTHDVANESGQAGGLIGYISTGKNTINNSSVKGGKFNVINGKGNQEKANSKFIGVIAGASVVYINNCTVDETGMTYNETGADNYTAYHPLVGGNRYGTAKLIVDGENVAAGAAGFIAAIGDVEDGAVITLSQDVYFTEENRTLLNGYYEGVYYEGDKSFTIDLNGKTIYNTDGAVNDYMLLFKNAGSKPNTITIKNGKIDTGSGAYSAVCTSATSTQQIAINLEDVELVGNNSNGSVVKIRGGAVANLNDGAKITGQDSYLGVECLGATVNIYGGAEILMNGTTSYNGSLVGVAQNGTVNIYGGYGKGTKGGLIAMTSGGTINAMGGEWIANTDGTSAVGNLSVLIAQSDKTTYPNADNSVINVTGGTYKGGYNCYGNAVGDAQINIQGGNFNADPKDYVDAGYEATQNVENTWDVTAE